MFGYVRYFKPHLRVCEYDTYKSVYCALCRSMGREYGILSRLTLNYDFTFLALLGLAMSEDECGFEKKHCTFNPLKKCVYCLSGSDVLTYSASVSVMTFYHKLRDDVADRGRISSIPSRLALLFCKPKYRRAAKRYPEQACVFEKYMAAQTELESAGCASIDRAADPTGRMLSSAFGQFSDSEASKRVLERLGYCLGRWVYLIDAADDLAEDFKNESFNPFISSWRLSSAEKSPELTAKLEETLSMCISEIASAVNLLETNRFRPILENIIREGMPSVQKSVLLGKEVTDERSL